MKRYGEEFELTQELMDTIASYMNDEKREDLHAELAPCEPEEFLRRYLELDPDFTALLDSEFGIEWENKMKKADLQELEKMSFEDGEKELISLGYYCSGSGETESNISDYAVDTYYTLEDEGGNEIDTISFSQFLNGRDDEEQKAEVVKEGWGRI